MRRLINQSGQTIVELVVALALLSTSAASAGTLATLSSRVGDESGRRSQAVALATREIEALRTYRDSQIKSGVTVEENWLPNEQTPSICSDNGSTGGAAFYMKPISDTRWTHATASAPVAFATESFGESLEEYSSFARLVSVCKDIKDSESDYIRDVRVIVCWQEASGPAEEECGGNYNRKVAFNTILTYWANRDPE